MLSVAMIKDSVVDLLLTAVMLLVIIVSIADSNVVGNLADILAKK
jgi:hypothetical protein